MKNKTKHLFLLREFQKKKILTAASELQDKILSLPMNSLTLQITVTDSLFTLKRGRAK